MNILALDFDDAIFPSNNTYFGRTSDNLEILKINMNRIKMMLEKYDMSVFIISSWHIILELEDNNIKYLREDKVLNNPHYLEEFCAYDIIANTLNGKVIGMSVGDRYADVNKLLEDNHKVVTIDDMDFSHIVHPNHLYCETKGFITNEHTYRINNFFKGFEK